MRAAHPPPPLAHPYLPRCTASPLLPTPCPPSSFLPLPPACGRSSSAPPPPLLQIDAPPFLLQAYLPAAPPSPLQPLHAVLHRPAALLPVLRSRVHYRCLASTLPSPLPAWPPLPSFRVQLPFAQQCARHPLLHPPLLPSPPPFLPSLCPARVSVREFPLLSPAFSLSLSSPEWLTSSPSFRTSSPYLVLHSVRVAHCCAHAHRAAQPLPFSSLLPTTPSPFASASAALAVCSSFPPLPPHFQLGLLPPASPPPRPPLPSSSQRGACTWKVGGEEEEVHCFSSPLPPLRPARPRYRPLFQTCFFAFCPAHPEGRTGEKGNGGGKPSQPPFLSLSPPG
mmetsp:Transcript_11328/g.29937  ORF Transcript_11328/g.29937 Transcript_11328/m.29937 type:complete len:337 (-) Transcript_11328:1233-2243(-)